MADTLATNLRFKDSAGGHTVLKELSTVEQRYNAVIAVIRDDRNVNKV